MSNMHNQSERAKTNISEDKSFVVGRRLSIQDMALLELYQRQDSMSTQMWQQFLFANVAVVGVIALIAERFDGAAAWVLSIPVLIIWFTYTYGGLGALRNSQEVLLSVSHQIHGDIGDRAVLFNDITRTKLGITVFHVFVDIGIFLLCISLLWNDAY